MARKLIFIGLLFALSTNFIFAATPQKSCVAINKIVNKSTADEEFFKTIMERLQNSIVNTGKFDVVDNTRLYEIASELKKQEDELSDEELDINLKLATISIHGTVLSMVVESKDHFVYNQQYSKTVGTMELTIRFQDMRTGTITASKQVKISKVGLEQKNSVMRDTSKKRKFTRIIEPEKVFKDSKTGKLIVVPAKTESIYFTPAEEKIYNEVMQAAVDDIVEKLMEHVYPMYVVSASNEKVYINMPEERSREKMSKGLTFEILQMGEDIIDPDTGESLGAEEERIMVVALQTIRPKMAIAIPVSGNENFAILAQGMKKYRANLKLAKTAKDRKKIKPPFQARQLAGNTAGTTADPAIPVSNSTSSDIGNRFKR